MTTISADEVRIPLRAREAIARHEEVIVLNRERPVIALVHPDDVPSGPPRRSRRTIGQVVRAIQGSPAPDPDFARDLEELHSSSGDVPELRWDR